MRNIALGILGSYCSLHTNMAFSSGFGSGGGGFGTASSAFGKPPSVFGAAPASPFGAPPASPSAFGAPAASPFGAASQQNAFNASAGSSSPFGGANGTLRPQGTVFGAGGGALGATGGQARASSRAEILSPLKNPNPAPMTPMVS